MALNLGPLNVLLRLQGANRFRRETESVASSLIKTGAAIGVAALAARKIAQEMAEATKVFAEFERGMVRVGAVTNSLGTQAFAGLTERAQELAATTEFTARQVADAMGFMGMAGMSTNKIFDATPAVLQLASAGMVDVAKAADVVTNVMSSYGMKTEDLTNANNVLVATFTGSNTSLESLGQSFKYVGSIAKNAGVDFREAAAVIGLMGNNGIQADMAGTALRGTIVKLLDPTDEGARIMRQYGIEVKDSSGKLKSMVEIFKQFEPIAGDSAKMIELFGLRAGPGFQAALSMGTAKLEALIGKIDNAGNIAERVAAAQLDTLDGKIKILGSNFEGLQIAIGAAFAPAATAGVEALSGYLGDAVKAVKELTAATDDASGSVAEFGTAANTAIRNYLRAIGATLGLNLEAVELTHEKTEAEKKLAEALEREEQIRQRLAYLGKEASFQLKQFGVASNAVTSEIEQLTEELDSAHGVVIRMGRDMRKVTSGGLPVARVDPNLGQDPASQRPPAPTPTRRTTGRGPAFDAMAATQDLFKGLPVFIGTTEMSIDDFNELLDNGTEIIIDHTEALERQIAQTEKITTSTKTFDVFMGRVIDNLSGMAQSVVSGNLGTTAGPALGQAIGAAIGAAFAMPQVGAAIGGAAGQVFGPLFDVIAESIGVFQPFIDLINRIAVEFFTPILVGMAPYIESMARVFGAILVPAARTLGDIFGVLQLVMSNFRIAIENLVTAIGNVMSGNILGAFTDGMKEFVSYEDYIENVNRQRAAILADLNGTTESTTERFRELNEELTNIPLGVKRLRMLQYGATRGQTAFPNRFNAPAWGA